MSPNSNQLNDLQRMKLIATLLLVAATFVFVIASILEEYYAWVGFVRATAEAAMVGAIADWFAVTALFRHPLGLKIPHTAIIPTRKHDLSRNFARFVRDNFLTETVIADKWHSMQATRKTALWLNQPANSALVADQMTVGVAAIIKIMKDEEIQALVQNRVIALIRSTPFSPFIAHLLQLVLAGERQQELMVEIARLGLKFLEENKRLILQRINHELPWWAVALGVEKRIYQALVETVDTTVKEVKVNPHHPLASSFQVIVTRFIADLKNSPEILDKEKVIKEEILQHTLVQEFSSSLWEDIKTSLLERGSSPDLEMHRAIQQVFISLGQAILNDSVLHDKVDRWLTEVVIYFTQTYGYEVEHLISTTIDRWDTAEVTRKVEMEVGRDLQFIRINGTVIGGLVGLVIYTAAFLLKQL